jgi:acyl-[acyl-carrier-protein]-phospholipid O-acyltransferase/long-chain-fatty-acid--[acyl-carrier-protein] ligase
MADAQNPHVTFGSALARTVFLARRLRKVWAGQDMVGLLLPPGIPGALTNHAALLCGKVPVNLNYTLPAEGIASCMKQCGIRTVITSRILLERLKLAAPEGAVYLEDLAKNPALSEKISAWLMAKLLPAGLLEWVLRDASHPHPDPLPSDGRGNSDEHGRAPRMVSETSTPNHACAGGLDSLATVIFSSGSTGEPKGVMLSHYNVGSNVEQLAQIFALDGRDRILGILPFFHSFGFTGTLALPAMLGTGVVFHPSPLDARAIGPLVRENAVTFLLATPTLLQLYLRGCAPGDFGSLRLVMTGAEKLPDRLATAFEERFGIRPLEGYGCTECSPVVAVNAPDFRGAGIRQVGGKHGKIGLPLPGLSVKIVDPDNPRGGKTMPLGESGMLLVSGPNVMHGYLGQPEKTEEVLIDDVGESAREDARPTGERRKETFNIQHSTSNPEGKTSCDGARDTGGCHDGKWYVTGDIAALDEDGFLQITGRLNRFSKVGGEMVPHLNVEDRLHELAGATEQTFVVTGVPDEKKGERLVVLHRLGDAELAACVEKLAACDLPNLWKLKADAFYRVENFPLLGTGKLDLRKLKEVAAKLAGET